MSEDLLSSAVAVDAFVFGNLAVNRRISGRPISVAMARGALSVAPAINSAAITVIITINASLTMLLSAKRMTNALRALVDELPDRLQCVCEREPWARMVADGNKKRINDQFADTIWLHRSDRRKAGPERGDKNQIRVPTVFERSQKVSVARQVAWESRHKDLSQ